MNMPCAYGQKYSYYLALKDTSEQGRILLGNARIAALRCIESGLKIDPSSIARFNELCHGSAPDPQGNDLQVFDREKDFDQLSKKYA
jgi:hypothetical protein